MTTVTSVRDQKPTEKTDAPPNAPPWNPRILNSTQLKAGAPRTQRRTMRNLWSQPHMTTVFAGACKLLKLAIDAHSEFASEHFETLAATARVAN